MHLSRLQLKRAITSRVPGYLYDAKKRREAEMDDLPHPGQTARAFSKDNPNLKVIHVSQLKDGQTCYIVKWSIRSDWTGFKMRRRGNSFLSVGHLYSQRGWGFSGLWAGKTYAGIFTSPHFLVGI